MNLTIIGASAGVGQETVRQALDRGHRVTALSRSGTGLPAHPDLTDRKGSALEKIDLMDVIAGADAVIVTLGTGRNTGATTLYSDFACLLIEVKNELNFQIPVVVLTGFGAGDSGAFNSLPMRLLFRLILGDVYADKTRMESVVANSAMKWVIVRPGRLTDGPFTGHYRVETELYKGMGIGAVSRADVADFLIRQAEKPTALYRYPALSGK